MDRNQYSGGLNSALWDTKKGEKKMKATILNAVVQLIGIVMTMLKPEHVNDLVDTILDWIEERVAASDNKIDDALVLPLCNTIRTALNVPDNDDDE